MHSILITKVARILGTYIDNQDINAVIPLGLDASYVVLASQDPFGLYDINEISLLEPLVKK